MRTVPAEQAARWWRQLEQHSGHGRCRPWADAFAALIAHDLYHLGPPPTIDRPHETTGTTRKRSA